MHKTICLFRGLMAKFSANFHSFSQYGVCVTKLISILWFVGYFVSEFECERHLDRKTHLVQLVAEIVEPFRPRKNCRMASVGKCRTIEHLLPNSSSSSHQISFMAKSACFNHNFLNHSARTMPHIIWLLEWPSQSLWCRKCHKKSERSAREEERPNGPFLSMQWIYWSVNNKPKQSSWMRERKSGRVECHDI